MESISDTRKRKFRCYSPNCRGKEVSEASFYKHKKRRKILEDANGSQEVIACKEWPDDSVAAEEVAIEEVDDFGFANGKIPAPADRDCHPPPLRTMKGLISEVSQFFTFLIFCCYFLSKFYKFI